MQKISVIMPVYNVKESYLRPAIESLLRQTYKNLEIIIVNDGSTDCSADIIKSYNDNRIVYLEQKNKGQGAARNLGIKKATGDYIGFIDSDDYVSDSYYETLYETTKKHNADISCGTICVVREHSKHADPAHKKIIAEDFVEKISSLPNGAIWDKLFNSDLIKRNNIYFPEIKTWEDNLFLLECIYNANKIAFTNEACYYYRINKKSTVHSRFSKRDKRSKEDSLTIANLMIDFANKHNFPPEDLQAVKKFIIEMFIQKRFIKDKTYLKKLKQIIQDDTLIEHHFKKSDMIYNHFYEKIFSIKKIQTTSHTIITILGIKIKFVS